MIYSSAYFLFAMASKTNILTLLCVVFVQNSASINSLNIDDADTPVMPIQKNDRHVADSYSEEENECLSNRKFLFGGKCYPLLIKGPCPKGEWLVLGKSDAVNRPMKAICQKKPCDRSNEVWWIDRCVKKSWAKNGPCRGNGKTVIVNPHGDGRCSCTDYYGEIENECYEYYQQGPCKSNEVVIYDKSSGNGMCFKDRCSKENVGGYRKYAPLNGKGKCYRLSSSDPCESVGNYSRFVIDFASKIPQCSYRTLQLNLIGSPVRCRLDENKNCRDPIDVKSEDRLTFVLQMKKHTELEVKKSKNKIAAAKDNLNKTTTMQNETTIQNQTMIQNQTTIQNQTMIRNTTTSEKSIQNSTSTPSVISTTEIVTTMLNETLIIDPTPIKNKTITQNIITVYNDTLIHNKTMTNHN